MIGRTNTGGGGGGGGGALTFVNGTTRPDKAKYNMVWVNTEHDITSYAFSATTPETLTEGMLCVYIDYVNGVPAGTPVGKEWIAIRMLGAKQCINGVMVSVPAMIYRDGGWFDICAFIIKSGEICEYGFSLAAINNYLPTVTQGVGYLSLEGYTVSDSGALTDKKIDLTDISEIELDVDVVRRSISASATLFRGVALVVATNGKAGSGGVFANYVVASTKTEATGRQKLILSVDNIRSGEYYVGVTMGGNQYDTNKPLVHVYDITYRK